MPVSAERKALFARRDLVNRLLQLAKARDISLYNLVNEIFEAYIRLSELNIRLNEVLDEVVLYRVAFSCGLQLFPSEVAKELLKDKCSNPDSILKLIRQSSARVARYYKAMYVEDLQKTLTGVVGVFEKTLNWIGEFDAKQVDLNTLVVTYTNNALPTECNKVITEYVRGALEELGFKSISFEEAGPVVKIVFEKQV